MNRVSFILSTNHASKIINKNQFFYGELKGYQLVNLGFELHVLYNLCIYLFFKEEKGEPGITGRSGNLSTKVR